VQKFIFCVTNTVTVAEIHFFRWGGGAKLPKFPTKLSNFRQPTPPPLFALEKAVFSPLLDQNFQIFTKISATGPTYYTIGLCIIFEQMNRRQNTLGTFSCCCKIKCICTARIQMYCMCTIWWFFNAR
jgi:hypothetical protein